MGLDISAYGKVELLETLDNIEDYENKYPWYNGTDTTYAYPETVTMTEKNWPGRCKGIVPGGVYKASGEILGFRAGSYHWYNAWREWLCQMVLGTIPKHVWNNPEKYEGKPFYELINFSDCEGIIGADVSRKLAQDFADHQGRAELDDDEWNVKQYKTWRKAFEIASDDGFVEFH